MNESLRQKKVARLIKDEVSRILIESFQAQNAGLISVTRVNLTKDLKTAHVYLSLLGNQEPEALIQLLKKRTGYIRKTIASRTKLKYNPQLIFTVDPLISYEENIGKIIDRMHDNEQ